MRKLILLSAITMLTACTAEPGSERWCEQKEGESKTEWSASDMVTYTKSCVIEGLAIGSDAWCTKLAEKPKGDWSTNEATSYAKHCVI
jgi:Protein of unknown function (DUF3012)